MLFTVIFIHR